MDEFEGVLKLRQVKKGVEHRVEFVNKKGRSTSFVVPPQARHYSEAAADGDACRLWLEGSIVVKCVVPGKEAAPAATPPEPAKNTAGAGNSGTGFRGGHGYGGQARSSGQQNGTPVTGTAPYNFVPCQPYAIVPPAEGESRKWSGRIVCRLEALTPLLVCGRQQKSPNAPTDCRFMQLDGKNIVPGTSLKGMLRSLMEILSFSGLRPVSKKRLFWRQVVEAGYLIHFPEEPLGGFLRKRGADYRLYPARVTPVPAGTPARPGSEKVKTGGFPLKGGGSSKAYLFELSAASRGIEIDREIVARFLTQLTPSQDKRWDEKMRARRLGSEPGLPVFYRSDDAGRPVELGFCRYFRLEYKYSPHDLVWPEGREDEFPDMARAIFGHVGKKSLRGRIAIEPFALDGSEYAPDGVNVVLGSPKPTCLPFYLDQPWGKIKVISFGKKNSLTSMRDYNEKDSRLRGRKLYWHHDVNPADFPAGNGNTDVSSCLHPLAPGATGEFVIHVDHLTDTELGCLFEALELRAGCAHRLGMGRALGFGSVRITVKEARLADSRQKYASLAARLQDPAPQALEAAKREDLRAIFRQHVFESLGKIRRGAEAAAKDYYSLAPIADLFLMLDYRHRPKPEAVATMSLKQFGAHPLLPNPRQVLGGQR